MEQALEAAEGTRELIETMARLRAGGDSWEDVSVFLKRPVCELKALAWERRAEWTGLFTEAAGLAALEVLADLAHGPDAHVAATAARTLLTHSRWAGNHEPQRHRDTEGEGFARGGTAAFCATSSAAEESQAESGSQCLCASVPLW